jgi:hypothetical protein
MQNSRVGESVGRGAVAGVIAASCMTLVRALARQSGLIERHVPQAVERTLARRLVGGAPPSGFWHQLADQALHLGYGGFLGALYGYAAARRRRPPSALATGAGTWTFGRLLLAALAAGRPPWRARASENTVDLVAHLVFGGVTKLIAADLETGARYDLHPFRRVG